MSVSLHVDDQPPVQLLANITREASTICGHGNTLGGFATVFTAKAGVDFTKGRHEVAGSVVGGRALGDSPGCIQDGKGVACKYR